MSVTRLMCIHCGRSMVYCDCEDGGETPEERDARAVDSTANGWDNKAAFRRDRAGEADEAARRKRGD